MELALAALRSTTRLLSAARAVRSAAAAWAGAAAAFSGVLTSGDLTSGDLTSGNLAMALATGSGALTASGVALLVDQMSRADSKALAPVEAALGCTRFILSWGRSWVATRN